MSLSRDKNILMPAKTISIVILTIAGGTWEAIFWGEGEGL